MHLKLKPNSSYKWLFSFVTILCSLASLLLTHPIWSTLFLIILFIMLLVSSKPIKPIFIIMLSISIGNIIMTQGYTYSFASILSLPTELNTVLSRFILLIYCFSFMILTCFTGEKTPKLSLGSFRGKMRFPFIWAGPAVPIWSFITIGALSNIVAYSFFIDLSIFNFSLLPTILLYAFLFALINSLLEEIFWRGFILNKLTSLLGQSTGLVLTSIIFGMYHYSFGMPWYICLLFMIGGLYMGDLALKAKGLLPITLFHFIINLGMYILLNNS